MHFLSIERKYLRAYLKTRLWIEAPCGNIGELMDPKDYGYEIDVSINSISPVLFQGPAKPTDVPDPCMCKN